MKRLTKLDLWQMGGFAILWFIHGRIDSLFFWLIPSAENYTLYMIGTVAAVALYKAVWFLGLWFICLAMRRRELRLKTLGIALPLALGLGFVSYYVRTPLFLFWGAALLVFRSAYPQFPPMKRKTILLFAAIILASFAYDLFATHMELRYFEQVGYSALSFLTLLSGTLWSKSAAFINQLVQCVLVFILSASLPAAEKTEKIPCFTALLGCTCPEDSMTREAAAILDGLNEKAPPTMRLRPPKDTLTVSDPAIFECLKAFFTEQVRSDGLVEEEPKEPYHVERNGEELLEWYATKWYRCLQCGCLWEFRHPDSDEEGFVRKFTEGQYSKR